MHGHGMGASCRWPLAISASVWLLAATAVAAAASPRAGTLDPAPAAADWVALSRLPDWSGYWIPDIRDQVLQETSNTPPWNAQVAKQMAQARADQDAGRPWGLFANCLPEGLPSGILVNHVGMEWVFAPGRVIMFGDGDGNKLRRIYTDGRGHSADPNPTLYGESVGHWEGQTLVVDTVGILPQAIVAINEAIGVPNDGDMHVVERIHLVAPDEMHDDMTITAPRILTKPWATTRIYRRDRRRSSEIQEAICVLGTQFTAGTDKYGHASWMPVQYDFGSGTPVPATPRSAARRDEPIGVVRRFTW